MIGIPLHHKNMPFVVPGREFPTVLGHLGSIFVDLVVGNHGDPEPKIIFFRNPLT